MQKFEKEKLVSAAGSKLRDRPDELLSGWQEPAAVLHELRSARRKWSVHGDKRVAFLFFHDASGYASVSLFLWLYVCVRVCVVA